MTFIRCRKLFTTTFLSLSLLTSVAVMAQEFRIRPGSDNTFNLEVRRPGNTWSDPSYFELVTFLKKPAAKTHLPLISQIFEHPVRSTEEAISHLVALAKNSDSNYVGVYFKQEQALKQFASLIYTPSRPATTSAFQNKVSVASAEFSVTSSPTANNERYPQSTDSRPISPHTQQSTTPQRTALLTPRAKPGVTTLTHAAPAPETPYETAPQMQHGSSPQGKRLETTASYEASAPRNQINIANLSPEEKKSILAKFGAWAQNEIFYTDEELRHCDVSKVGGILGSSVLSASRWPLAPKFISNIWLGCSNTDKDPGTLLIHNLNYVPSGNKVAFAKGLNDAVFFANQYCNPKNPLTKLRESNTMFGENVSDLNQSDLDHVKRQFLEACQGKLKFDSSDCANKKARLRTASGDFLELQVDPSTSASGKTYLHAVDNSLVLLNKDRSIKKDFCAKIRNEGYVNDFLNSVGAVQGSMDDIKKAFSQ